MSDATAHPSDPPVGFIDAEPAQPVDQQAKEQEESTSRSDRARKAGYHSRFVAVYVGLALVAGIGVGALVVSILKDDKAPARQAAAQVTPSDRGELGAIELAESMQKKYRLQNGDELVAVIASRNTLQEASLGLMLVVRFQYIQPSDSSADRDSKVVIPKDAIQYSLCGTGPSCEIPGTATPARFTLLKREGLELALRTFQNDPAVDNVAVFLRPVAAQQPWEGYTMVFDRSELNHSEPGLLSRPLGATLPGLSKTVTAKALKRAEQRRIEELTRPYVYQYRYQILGGRDALMQLQPVKG